MELAEKGILVPVLLPGPADALGFTKGIDADMITHLLMKPQPINACVKKGYKSCKKTKLIKL